MIHNNENNIKYQIYVWIHINYRGAWDLEIREIINFLFWDFYSLNSNKYHSLGKINMLKYILCVHDFVGGLRKLNYLYDLDYFIFVMDFIQSYFYLYIIFYLLISI